MTAEDAGVPGTARRVGARGFGGVGLASLVAAACGYVVLLLAARTLSTAQNAEFLAFWALLFFFFGALGGLQSEATRSVHLAVERPVADGRHPLVLRTGLGVGAVLAVAVAATSPLWAHAVLGPHPWPFVAVVVLAVLAFAGHSATAGVLAGQGRWGTYAQLVGAESLVRLVVTATAAALGLGIHGLAVGAGTAAATWVALSAVPHVREVRRQRADSSARQFLAAAGQAMAGTASSAALVVGFPVLLRITSTPEAYAHAAPLLLAVQLTRAPLLIPLNAYQGVAITHFLAHRAEGIRSLRKVAAVVVGVGAAGAAAAALVGPALMALVLGPDYRVAAWVLAGLTATAAALALLTLTGAAVIALGQHTAYAAGWLTATIVSALVLLAPGALEPRAVISLGAGPLAGLLVHTLGIRKALAEQR